MVSVRTKNTDRIKGFLINLNKRSGKVIENRLKEYGVIGCQALTYATPFKTGQTAMSWSYEIVHENGSYSLNFKNSHIENGVNIAIILNYGHPTRNGGWVEGRNYIDPAIQPIFDDLLEKAWGEIKAL